jgi:hypothetical protein
VNCAGNAAPSEVHASWAAVAAAAPLSAAAVSDDDECHLQRRRVTRTPEAVCSDTDSDDTASWGRLTAAPTASARSAAPSHSASSCEAAAQDDDRCRWLDCASARTPLVWADSECAAAVALRPLIERHLRAVALRSGASAAVLEQLRLLAAVVPSLPCASGAQCARALRSLRPVVEAALVDVVCAAGWVRRAAVCNGRASLFHLRQGVCCRLSLLLLDTAGQWAPSAEHVLAAQLLCDALAGDTDPFWVRLNDAHHVHAPPTTVLQLHDALVLTGALLGWAPLAVALLDAYCVPPRPHQPALCAHWLNGSRPACRCRFQHFLPELRTCPHLLRPASMSPLALCPQPSTQLPPPRCHLHPHRDDQPAMRDAPPACTGSLGCTSSGYTRSTCSGSACVGPTACCGSSAHTGPVSDSHSQEEEEELHQQRVILDRLLSLMARREAVDRTTAALCRHTHTHPMPGTDVDTDTDTDTDISGQLMVCVAALRDLGTLRCAEGAP